MTVSVKILTKRLDLLHQFSFGINKISVIFKSSNNLYENAFMVLCEIIQRFLKTVCFHRKCQYAMSCGTFVDVSQYKNYNEKWCDLLAMPFRIGQSHRKLCDLSYLLLKTFSLESFNFLYNACLFVSMHVSIRRLILSKFPQI